MSTIYSESDTQTEQIASQVASAIQAGTVIHLQGDLGVGKTTFSRGLINSLGFDGAVKSPTYNIVQSYTTGEFEIYHFDLYRLSEPEELEALGFRDYFDGRSICLLEWPEKGAGYLPEPDLQVVIDYKNTGRSIDLIALSEKGHTILNKVQLKS